MKEPILNITSKDGNLWLNIEAPSGKKISIFFGESNRPNPTSVEQVAKEVADYYDNKPEPTQQPQQPIILLLEEFKINGDMYIQCVYDEQEPLLSHLLGNEDTYFAAEEFTQVQNLAAAHGWGVHLKYLNDE